VQLKVVPLHQLYFPKERWQWLRASQTVSKDDDFFVWGVELDSKIWAWTKSGSELISENSSLEIPVLIVNANNSELEAHGLYLKTTFESKSAQDIEWQCALDVLKNTLKYSILESGLPRYWESALQACDLNAHLGTLSQRGKFSFFTIEERQFLFHKRWDPSSLELFESLNIDLRSLFLKKVSELNISANQTKESVQHLTILFRKFGENSAKNVLNNSYKSAEEFRLALFRIAQPELASLSEERLTLLRSLKLPPRTAVFGDPSFEKDIIRITHTPRNMSDYETFKDWITDPALEEKFNDLFEIYQ
jgi:hypothetical protein